MKITLDFDKKEITIQGKCSVKEVCDKCEQILGADLVNWNFNTSQKIEFIERPIPVWQEPYTIGKYKEQPFWYKDHPLRVTCEDNKNHDERMFFVDFQNQPIYTQYEQ